MKLLFETIDQTFSNEEVSGTVSEIIQKSENLGSQKYYELALSCIDLTTLNSTDTPAQGEKFALKVSLFSNVFPDYPLLQQYASIRPW